jgi:hypothetical protein
VDPPAAQATEKLAETVGFSPCLNSTDQNLSHHDLSYYTQNKPTRKEETLSRFHYLKKYSIGYHFNGSVYYTGTREQDCTLHAQNSTTTILYPCSRKYLFLAKRGRRIKQEDIFLQMLRRQGVFICHAFPRPPFSALGDQANNRPAGLDHGRPRHTTLTF